MRSFERLAGLAPETDELVLEDDEDFEGFVDLDDLPADEPPEPDGDQHLIDPARMYDPVAIATVGEPGEVLLSAAGRLARRRVVPYVRELRRGKRGKDVRALQRALRAVRPHLRARPARTGIYWVGTYKAVREFQGRKGLGQDGVYGKRTHHALMPRYDAYGLALLIEAQRAQKKRPGPNGNAAKIVEATAFHSYNNRHRMLYTQGPSRWAGISSRIKPPGVPPWSDCSSWYTWLLWVADQALGGKIPDPNRLSWQAGYTGTLCPGSGRKGPKQTAAAGFYGPHTHRHVVVAVGSGDMVISMGSSSGPHYLPTRYRSDFDSWSLYPGLHF